MGGRRWDEGDRIMAKALYGHLPAADQRLLNEVARLRARVRDLEAHVERLELERSLDLTVDTLLAPAAS